MNNLDDSLSFARSTDPDTSHAAAASLLNTGLDALVFAVIAKSGERGATLDDLEDACPEVKVVSLSPRPARLEEKGLVYDTGERRLGRSGRLQRVLRAVEHGSTASLALPAGGKRKSRTAPAPQTVIDAFEVFRIAGGDVECDPHPTAERALDCLRDLRQRYDEALSHQAPPERLQDVTLAERLLAHSRDCAKAADMTTDYVIYPDHLEQIVKDLAEAAAALSVRGWQDIASAPKDGTVVMFHVPGKLLPIMSRGDDFWYGRNAPEDRGVAYWLDDATHWMPLPEAPATPPSEG